MKTPVSKSLCEERIKELKSCSTLSELKGLDLGTLLWAKLDLANLNLPTWWPVQVVDERAVSEDNIYNEKMDGGILVRYYGSYIYVWMDPVLSLSQFYSSFKGKGKSSINGFRALMQEDFSGNSMQSNPKSDNQATSSKKRKTSNRKVKDEQDKSAQSVPKGKDQSLSNKEDNGDSGEKTVRKLKVMRHLGLAAPSGSPY